MDVRLRSLGLGVSLALAACSEESSQPKWASIGHRCSSNAPATALSVAARDSLLPDVDSPNDSDARWARVARDIPGGWGGYFIDDGKPTIYLTDTSRRADAIAALNQRGVDGRILGPDVQVRLGRWDFAQLYDWYRYLNRRVSNVSIVSSDIDEAHNRILYGISSDSGVRKLESRLTALGVPCHLVAFQRQGVPTLARR